LVFLGLVMAGMLVVSMGAAANAQRRGRAAGAPLTYSRRLWCAHTDAATQTFAPDLRRCLIAKTCPWRRTGRGSGSGTSATGLRAETASSPPWLLCSPSRPPPSVNRSLARPGLGVGSVAGAPTAHALPHSDQFKSLLKLIEAAGSGVGRAGVLSIDKNTWNRILCRAWRSLYWCLRQLQDDGARCGQTSSIRRSRFSRCRALPVYRGVYAAVHPLRNLLTNQ
jgi:hypothetical protein